MILLTAAQSRELDRLSRERYGIPSYDLMTRAGEAVATSIMRHWPAALTSGVLVVAGKGNNGGDGCVAAGRLLQGGTRVHVILLAHIADLRGDAARACADFVSAGGEIMEVTDVNAVTRVIEKENPAVIVDAIFGTGLNAEITGLPRAAIDAINAAPAPVIAVDIASGINADDGAVMGVAVAADVTVTFGYAKYGHILYPGKQFCGELEIVDIGFAPEAIRGDNPSLTCYSDSRVSL